MEYRYWILLVCAEVCICVLVLLNHIKVWPVAMPVLIMSHNPSGMPNDTFVQTAASVPQARSRIELIKAEHFKTTDGHIELKPQTTGKLKSPAKEQLNSELPRLCTNRERLDMVSQYCRKHRVAQKYIAKLNSTTLNNSTSSSRDFLDEIPDAEILKLSHELWLDPVHEVIVCMHAKAGCSTWKTILANNSGESLLKESSLKFIHDLIFQRGMKCADDSRNATEIRRILRTGYKFAIVRHPFDRLVSSYNEKLAGNNTLAEMVLGSFILKKYQSHLPSMVKNRGEGVLFQDFIQFILDFNPMNDHFRGPYEDKCHACLFNYNYIVKLETNDIDSRFIIRNKLRGRGLDTETHVNSKRRTNQNAWQKGRDLSRHFSNLTSIQYQDLKARHAIDFGMYGYTIDDLFVARCAAVTNNGSCC